MVKIDEIIKLSEPLKRPENRLRNFQEDRNLYAPLESMTLAVYGLIRQVWNLENRVKELSESLSSKPNMVSFFLTDLSSEDYIVSSPMSAILEIYENEAIAQLVDLDAFGSGVTPTEAIQDLKAQVITLFEDLQDSRPEELGAAPERWKKFLSEHIKKIGSSQEVGKSIDEKVRPSGGGREDTGWFYLDGKKQLRVTVPRGHGPLAPGTCNKIKRQLHLTNEEFRALVKCPMTSTDYEKLIREKIAEGRF